MSTTSTEPAERPIDNRFTYGLLYDVIQVLERHGYRPPAVGPDGDQSIQHLAYGTAMSHLLRLVRAFEGTEDSP